VIGAIFYSALGPAPSTSAYVTAMVVAMSVNAVLVGAAAVTTLLLPSRAASRAAAPRQEAAAPQPVAVPQAAALASQASAANAAD
jgi:hypothetical protein